MCRRRVSRLECTTESVLESLRARTCRQHCARVARRQESAERGARCSDALSEGRWAEADEQCPPRSPARAHMHNYCYAEHVREWHAAFGAENVRLLKSEELRHPATRRAQVQGLAESHTTHARVLDIRCFPITLRAETQPFARKRAGAGALLSRARETPTLS